MLLTFLLVVIGWVFFRAETIKQAFEYLGGIFNSSLVSVPFIPSGTIRTFASIAILLFVEWSFRLKNHPFEISKFHLVLRYVVYYALILIILEFGANSQSFIYLFSILMRKFILTTACFFIIPIIILLSIYYWTDPFKILKPFDINDVDATNREYMSTELFLRNMDSITYNSFIFGSSRAGGFNTYTWKLYLEDNAQPYLFQAWSETLTGIYLKLAYLDKNNINIDNAIILFDIPSTFATKQLPTEVLTLKHHCFTNASHFQYSMTQFYNFCQKPSLWISSIKKKINNTQIPYSADLITNDWEAKNKDNYDYLPKQDSLKSCSEKTRKTFLYKYEQNKDKEQVTSNPLINEEYLNILKDIHAILDKHQTDYKIIISPAICKRNPKINPQDLCILKELFDESNVYDYSSCNELTSDYNNFSDPGHFGSRVGYIILKDIYNNNTDIE